MPKRQKTFKWYSVVFKWVKIQRRTPPFWILSWQPPLWWDKMNSCFPFVPRCFVWINLREQKQFDSGYEPVNTENETWKCEISLLQTWTLVISLVMATQTPYIWYNFGMSVQFTSYIEFMLGILYDRVCLKRKLETYFVISLLSNSAYYCQWRKVWPRLYGCYFWACLMRK